jgi:hypothetical protein
MIFKASKKRKYTIVANLEDHLGYKGETVKITEDHGDGYHSVRNALGDEWYCGEEELMEVNK